METQPTKQLPRCLQCGSEFAPYTSGPKQKYCDWRCRNEYNRNRALMDGKCTLCKKHPARPNKKTCQPCADKATGYRTKEERRGKTTNKMLLGLLKPAHTPMPTNMPPNELAQELHGQLYLTHKYEPSILT